MDELGLTLDPKDFAMNRYQVDEHEHPRCGNTKIRFGQNYHRKMKTSTQFFFFLLES